LLSLPFHQQKNPGAQKRRGAAGCLAPFFKAAASNRKSTRLTKLPKNKKARAKGDGLIITNSCRPLAHL